MTRDPLDGLRLPLVPVEPRSEVTAALRRRIETGDTTPHLRATVRYFVDDLDRAVAFYSDELDFEVELRPSPAFAMLYRGDLRLLLSASAGHVLADGSVPEPGGWNRISLQVADLAAEVDALRRRGVRFRNDVVTGVGVRQSCSRTRRATWSSSSNPVRDTTSVRGETPVCPKVERAGPTRRTTEPGGRP